MKILSFVLDSTKFSWLMVEGTQEHPVLRLPLKRSKYPDEVELGAGLASVLKTARLLLNTEKPDAIAILQAGYSKFGGASPARIKVEAMLQLAAAENGIATYMVSPLTNSAKRKRLAKDGTTVIAVLNDSKEFSPKDTEDAALTGWVKLPNE